MRKCSKCKGKMKELTGKTSEGVNYDYFRCNKCNDEILNMAQLHNVAGKYRAMKKFHAKLTKWGLSLGLRIPKELVDKYKLTAEEEVTILPEKGGIKIIPA